MSNDSMLTEETRFSSFSIGDQKCYSFEMVNPEDYPFVEAQQNEEKPEIQVTLNEFMAGERGEQMKPFEAADKTQDFIEQEKFAAMMLNYTQNEGPDKNLLMSLSSTSMIVHSDSSPVKEEENFTFDSDKVQDSVPFIEEPFEVNECLLVQNESIEVAEEAMEPIVESIELETGLIMEPVSSDSEAETTPTFEVECQSVFQPQASPEPEFKVEIKAIDSEVEVNSSEEELLPTEILELDHCTISKKSKIVTTILGRSVTYKKLKIGYAKIITVDENLEPFWTHLGRSVTHLDLSSATHETNFINIFDIIPYFMNLEVLEINFKDSVNPLKTSRFMSVQMPIVPKLILHKLCANHLETLDLFIKQLPDVKLYIRSCSELEYNEESFMKLVKRHAALIKDLGRELLELMLNSYKGFLLTQMRVMKLQSLECNVAEIESYGYIPGVLKVNKDIKSIKLWNCFDFPAFQNLKFLHIKFPQDVKSFKPLEALQKLEGLEFEFTSSRWRCFFGHEALNCPKLRYIGMTIDKECEKCWLSLLISVKLDKMKLVTDFNHFEAMRAISNAQSLNDLELFSTEPADVPILDGFKTIKKLKLRNFDFSREFYKSSSLISLETEGILKSRVIIDSLKYYPKLEVFKMKNTAEEHLSKTVVFDKLQKSCKNMKVSV